MARNIVSDRRLMASIIVLIMLATTAICFLQIGSDSEPVLKARTMQAWPSGTIVVNVTDVVGRGIVGATVRTTGNVIFWQNQTGSDGSVTISLLPADDNATNDLTYQLNASMPGYRDSAIVFQNVSENSTEHVTLVIFGGSILGTVTTSLGGTMAPVEGANVTIASLGFSTTVSPSSGAYQLDGVPAGTVSVTANASGYVPSSHDIVMPLGGNILLNFVLISQNGSISGKVYHSTLHTGLNNTNVSVRVGSFTITVMSGSDGSYNLTNLPEGTYTLTAEREGFLSIAIADVVVTRGNITVGVDFNLTEKPTRLYGVVRSGTRLLVGANVSVVGTSTFNLSGPDGNYEIGNLTAGTYSVSASSPGYETAIIADVVMPEGGEIQLNINLTGLPGALISGVVRDAATGLPLANVLVTIVDIDPARAGVATDINGAYGLPGLDPGNYTVRFEKTGYRPVEISNVIVTKDGETKQKLEMTPLRNGFEGFIPGFDIPHSMMLMALCLTIIIFALAVYLRHRSFETPESAPAIYDQAEEEEAEKETTVGGEESEDLQKEVSQRKIRKSKNGGD
ncbi:MAG: carboxypeptidase-like regulatory domain-containing protein [Thermoplasmata archaeon]|nr:carboxypeptidase-like regulatory domain-containing protein [Thermoplasmata archaeon]